MANIILLFTVLLKQRCMRELYNTTGNINIEFQDGVTNFESVNSHLECPYQLIFKID